MSESCTCGPKRQVVLHVTLSRDDLPCGVCGARVPLDRVTGPREAIHLVRRWVDEAFAIEMLWFASGDYAAWAKGELDGPKSKVNTLGRQAAQKMSAAAPTWLYFAPHAEARQAIDKYLDHCPACHAPTEPTGLIPKYGLGCSKCRVAGSAE
jgi:hypothetical protein